MQWRWKILYETRSSEFNKNILRISSLFLFSLYPVFKFSNSQIPKKIKNKSVEIRGSTLSLSGLGVLGWGLNLPFLHTYCHLWGEGQVEVGLTFKILGFTSLILWLGFQDLDYDSVHGADFRLPEKNDKLTHYTV